MNAHAKNLSGLAELVSNVGKVECSECGAVHIQSDWKLAASTAYCGPIYWCSERCKEEWEQFGRWER
jgi:late competence protein required for DNA uptake (superfamily II DNA/RNA helicase)